MLCSVKKATEAYLGFCGPLVGCPVQARQHVWHKGRVRQICFVFCSCLSNAPSSEAVLLFKPLKELRAKRKGTHLVGLHACAFLETFYPCVVWMRTNLTEKMKRLKLFIFASCPVKLLLLFLCESVRFELLFHWTGQLKQMTFSQTDVLCWFWQARWDLVSRIFLCYFKGKESRLHPPLLHWTSLSLGII